MTTATPSRISPAISVIPTAAASRPVSGRLFHGPHARCRTCALCIVRVLQRRPRRVHVDLARELGVLGENRYAGAGHGEEATVHRGGDEATVRRADAHHATLDQLTENGLVTGQDADLPLGRL